MQEKTPSLLTTLRERTPLVYSITNYVTVNDCANALLALGGSPIMSDEIDEADELASICSALVLNIGTLNNRTVKTMLKAGKTARAKGTPVVFDPVGAGATALRSASALSIINEVKPTLIKGNISEIKFLARESARTRGVDAASEDLEGEQDLKIAQRVAAMYNAIVVITGKTDIVADKNTTYLINNGHKKMGSVCGTGCMLAAVLGCFLACECSVDSAAYAVALFGVCGELAAEGADGLGLSSYKTLFLDAINKIRSEDVENRKNITRI